jgi:hypothetical protein
MHYNEDIFAKFRALAITDVNQLEIGKTYYSNSESFPITVEAILTWNELRKRNGHERIFDASPEDNELGWIVYGPEEYDRMSLRDHNVGDSYNPWLLFADEATRDQCVSELEVSFVGSRLDAE